MEDATHLLFYDAIVILPIQPMTHFIHFIERNYYYQVSFSSKYCPFSED